MSRWEPTLREIATAPDEDTRLEMAAKLDREAEELDERYETKDAATAAQEERDRIAAELDEEIVKRQKAEQEAEDWKKRYADRFFTDPDKIKRDQDKDIQYDNKPHSFAELFANRQA